MCSPPGGWFKFLPGCRYSNQRGQYVAKVTPLLSECEVDTAEYLVKFVVYPLLGMVRLEDTVRRTNFILGLFHRLESARCQKRKNGRTQTGNALRGHQNWTPKRVGIDSVQDFILLRNSSGIDYSLHPNTLAL